MDQLREYCGSRTGVEVSAPCWVTKWTEANATRTGSVTGTGTGSEGGDEAVVFRLNDRWGPTLWDIGFLYWDRVDVEEDSALHADWSNLTGSSQSLDVEIVQVQLYVI